jgi:hypothetical protein
LEKRWWEEEIVEPKAETWCFVVKIYERWIKESWGCGWGRVN